MNCSRCFSRIRTCKKPTMPPVRGKTYLLKRQTRRVSVGTQLERCWHDQENSCARHHRHCISRCHGPTSSENHNSSSPLICLILADSIRLHHSRRANCKRIPSKPLSHGSPRPAFHLYKDRVMETATIPKDSVHGCRYGCSSCARRIV